MFGLAIAEFIILGLAILALSLLIYRIINNSRYWPKFLKTVRFCDEEIPENLPPEETKSSSEDETVVK